MATIRSRIARATGTNRITQYKKSAKTSAGVFAQALRSGSSKARKALGLRSVKSKQAKNITRRKSLGGKGG